MMETIAGIGPTSSKPVEVVGSNVHDTPKARGRGKKRTTSEEKPSAQQAKKQKAQKKT